MKRRTLCTRSPAAAQAGVRRCCRNSNIIGSNLTATVERKNPSLHQDLEMQWKFHIASSPCHKIIVRNCPTRQIKPGYWSQHREDKKKLRLAKTDGKNQRNIFLKRKSSSLSRLINTLFSNTIFTQAFQYSLKD